MTRTFAAGAALVLIAGAIAWAGVSYPYYSNNTWYSARATTGQTYYYTQYYYTAKSYHTCYYYPYVSRRYVYYYNPTTRRYWGRFDIESGKYSMLAENTRKEKLEDIKEADFPAAQALNAITLPDTQLKMTAPPQIPKEAKEMK